MKVNKYFVKKVIQGICFSLCFFSLNSMDLSANNVKAEMTLSNPSFLIAPPDCSNFKAKVIIHQLPDCGVANGSVTIEVTGATGQVSYSWGNSASMNNLAAMGYWVTVRDESGCERMVDFELKEQGCAPKCNLKVIPEILHPNCDNTGGSICLNVSGATGAVTYSWDGDACLTNIGAGNYVVQVSDEICTYTLNVQLVAPTAFQCSNVCTLEPSVVINSEPSCMGMDGSVCINATGAQGPVRYSWGPTGCYDNLVPGRYTVIVSDNVCSKTITFDLGDPNCFPMCKVTATPTIHRQPFCMDGKNANGAVSITAAGGTAPYTYSWGSQSSYNNLMPGFYLVTVTDAEGCSAGLTFNLDDPFCPSSCHLKTTVTYNKLPSCLANNGKVTLSVAGNENSVTYHWDDGLVTSNPTRENLTATDYQVIINENNTVCSDTIDFSLKYHPPCQPTCDTTTIAAALTINSQPFCDTLNNNAKNNGSVSVSVSGGVGPFTYSWGTDATMTNLLPGSYVVTVTDSLGCTAVTQTINLIDPPCPQNPCDTTTIAATLIINSQPFCDTLNNNAKNNGSVSVSVSGGVGPFTYSWGADATMTNLLPGSYVVTVTDANGCIAVTPSITLMDPMCPDPPGTCFQIDLVDGFSPDCDSTNGYVIFVISGQVGPMQYAWDDGLVTSDSIRNGLAAGNYEIIVTDLGTNCMDTASILLLEPDCCFTEDVVIKNPSCTNNDGSVAFTIMNAKGTITYEWNDNVVTTNSLRSGLSAGSYMVTLTDDSTDCTIKLEITLTLPPDGCDCSLVAGYEVIKAPDCDVANGEVAITHTGAKSSVSYIWSDSILTDSIRTDLFADSTYIVIVKEDSSDCADTISFVLEKMDSTMLSLRSDSVCTDSVGGLAFEITGCFVAPVEVRIFNGMGQLVTTIDDYVSGNSRIEDLVSEEDYVFIATGGDGDALGNEPFRIGAFPDFEATDSLSNECDAKGFIELMVDGGNDNYTFDWLDDDMENSSIRNNLDSGEYTVIITDKATQCKIQETYPIDKAIGPDISIGNNMVTCFVDSLQLMAINGKPGDSLTYDWSFSPNLMANNSTIANPLVWTDSIETTVEAKVLVTNQFDCSTSRKISITIRDTLATQRASFLIASHCDSNLVSFKNLNPDANLFIWDFGDPTTEDDTSSLINPSYLYPDTGEYLATLTVIPDYVCSRQRNLSENKMVKLEGPINLMAAFEFEQDPCVKPDEMLFTNASTIGSSTIDSLHWLLNGKQLPNQIGDSLLQMIDQLDEFEIGLEVFSGACEDEIQQEIAFNIQNDSINAVACLGDEIQLNRFVPIEGTIIYDPMVDSVITIDAPTTVTGRVFTEDVCVNFKININPEDPPEYALRGDTTLCDELQQVSIGVTSPDAEDIIWSENIEFDDIISEEDELMVGVGKYYLELNNGCVIDSVIIGQRNIVTETSDPESLCMPSTLGVEVEVTNQEEGDILTYQWTSTGTGTVVAPTDTIRTAEVMVDNTTQFKVEVSNQFGCITTDSVTVVVRDISMISGIEVNATEKSVVPGGSSSLVLSEPIPEGYTITWMDDISLDTTIDPVVATPDVSTTYTAIISLDGAAQGTCSVPVEERVEVVVCNSQRLFFPNAFSPNDDGRNDVLRVRGAEGFISMNLIVYNRWGQKVFESNNPDNGWDGVFEGEPVCADVYGYYLTVTCPSETIVQKGNVTVLK